MPYGNIYITFWIAYAFCNLLMSTEVTTLTTMTLTIYPFGWYVSEMYIPILHFFSQAKRYKISTQNNIKER